MISQMWPTKCSFPTLALDFKVALFYQPLTEKNFSKSLPYRDGGGGKHNQYNYFSLSSLQL